MRRLLALAAALALLLAGCGGAGGRNAPKVAVGSLGAPLGLAPLGMASGPPGLSLVPAARSLTATFVVAPSDRLPQLAAEGFTAIGALCASAPDVLLWHARAVFAWPDLDKAPLYVAPGADPGALGIALARYRGVLDHVPAPAALPGGVAAFRRNMAAFLLAPEPLASRLLSQGLAELAQPLAVELGPYPTCLLYVRRSVARQDPLLVEAVLRRADLGLLALGAGMPRRELAQVRALAPHCGPAAWLTALEAARAEGVFASTALIGPQALALLHREIAPGDWPAGALDLSFARAALRRLFVEQ